MVAVLTALVVAVAFAAALVTGQREWFVAAFVTAMLVWGFLKKDRWTQ